MAGPGSTIWQVIRGAGEEATVAIEGAVLRAHPAVASFARTAGLSPADADEVAQRVCHAVFDEPRESPATESLPLRAALFVETRKALGSRPTPAEGEFDRAWLQALLSAALSRMAERSPAEHSALRAFLADERPPGSAPAALAAADSSLRAVLLRARERIARLLRDEIRDCAASESEFLEELRRLAPLLGAAPRP